MITEHTICALPEGHGDYRYFAIKVQRRGDGNWVINWGGYYRSHNPNAEDGWYPGMGAAINYDEDGWYPGMGAAINYDEDGWYPGMGDAINYDEVGALALAEELKLTVEPNGMTVADALARTDR